MKNRLNLKVSWVLNSCFLRLQLYFTPKCGIQSLINPLIKLNISIHSRKVLNLFADINATLLV